MKRLIAALTLVVYGCTGPDKNALLVGTWRTDSVYAYYNGFGFTRRDFEEEPVRHYQPDGQLMMVRGDELRTFLYQVQHGDSLVHRTQDQGLLEKFLIVKLEGDQMVLQKELKPILPGEKQRRYHIRYLSRIK